MADAAVAGRAAEELLRHRPLQPRQLHLDGQRPGDAARHAGRLPATTTTFTGSVDTSGNAARPTPTTGRSLGRRAERRGRAATAASTRPSVPTLFNQLDAAGVSWKGYAQDLGNPDARAAPAPRRAGTAVLRRAVRRARAPTGSTAQPNPGSANATDQYVPKHFPFPWFESILKSGDCNSAHIANLFAPTDGLYHDLQSEATTPAFSWISPEQLQRRARRRLPRQQPLGRLRADPNTPEPAGELHRRPVRGRPVPGARHPRDRGLAGVQGRRPDRHHLRRGVPAVHLHRQQLRQLDDRRRRTRRPRSPATRPARRCSARASLRSRPGPNTPLATDANGERALSRARATTPTSTARPTASPRRCRRSPQAPACSAAAAHPPAPRTDAGATAPAGDLDDHRQRDRRDRRRARR